MKLLELFENPVPFEWHHKGSDNWYGEFTISGNMYEISIASDTKYYYSSKGKNTDQEVMKIWDLAFHPANQSLSGSSLVSSNGNEIAIFSTVINATKEFLHEEKPEYFSFTASREQTNRFPLYTKILKRFLPELEKLGYIQIESPDSHESMFNDRLRLMFRTMFDMIVLKRIN